MNQTSRIAAVVLAAGGSTRFGSPKQLIVHNGEALVRRAARCAVEAGADSVFVVVGSDADRVTRELHGIERVTTVMNPHWSQGLASSLSIGLREVLERADADGVLILLVDQPTVDATALARLIDAFGPDRRIVASSYDEVIGVPALFGIEYAEELSALTGDKGAGDWLRQRITDVTAIPLEVAKADIDTPADLAKLKARQQTFRS